MLDIQQSDATQNEFNKKLIETKRKKGEDNVQWLNRNLPKKTPDNVFLVLVGGSDTPSIRLRSAQAYARHNLTPSNWSHILFLDTKTSVNENTGTHEVNLSPPRGFGFPPEANGIQEGSIGFYKDKNKFPNIALLNVPVEHKNTIAAIKRFNKMRNVVNGPDLIVTWLSYLWGVTGSRNPLLEGLGIPSAVLVEYAVGAAGLDLTPGLASRSSCPEAVWQAAKWWHKFYIETQSEKEEEKGGTEKDPIVGNWCVDHRI